ncbi:AlpA family phage regulatory protein [Burkholderia stagnalis]|uniref:AlpA family phage regulatory protein n=1 Tax=Burkholderia metallica TaxID=488729 RepID=A0ABT8P7P0_9BURK|nr:MULTISPECIES: AlpA family phage regulatory protein [Burkholderia cepacia complex]MBH9722861.1 AlpA family phage regulatory protein [Burkholderia contaminans]MDN7931109.1 AlpA family phage regulatory protein [Burkholderia metallica]RQQ34918.1 AlpA family phage regulatory protein [Burkholderia stagnalis]RQQ38675.1 AlpA family phage regulatory protein [Burkholderia stagnalis]RQQ47049.1 AlpA family phage regulatory protein [Burkholderia stagnalis]
MQQNELNASSAPERLIRFGEVLSRTQLSKTEIYRRIHAGKFPPAVKLGLRAVAWREADVNGWIRNLPQQHGVSRNGGC